MPIELYNGEIDGETTSFVADIYNGVNPSPLDYAVWFNWVLCTVRDLMLSGA